MTVAVHLVSRLGHGYGDRVDVSLSGEQRAWQEAVATLAAEHAITPAAGLPAGDDPAAWAAVTALGLTGLRSRAETDGAPTGVESALAAEQLARQLCGTPVLGQALIAAELLDAAGAAYELAGLVAGDRIAPVLTGDLRDFGASGWAFDALGAGRALLVTGDPEAPGLAFATLDETGPEGLDLTRTLRPVGAAATAVPVGTTIGRERWAQVRAFALTVLAADALGVMDAAVADAVTHAGSREQFGVAIGSFQALQHLLADAAIQVEGARSCVWHAAWAVDHADPADALLAARTAKAYCARAGVAVVEATVQVFGGLAITWEHSSHLRLRRVRLDRQVLGDENVHHRAIADLRIAQHGAA